MSPRPPPALTFACTGCGDCCREPGHVYFDDDDIARAAAVLALTPEAFAARYIRKVEKLRFVRVTRKVPCVFLEANRCAIYEGRPKQCSTFPYWPEHMNERGELVNLERPCRGCSVVPEVE